MSSSRPRFSSLPATITEVRHGQVSDLDSWSSRWRVLEGSYTECGSREGVGRPGSVRAARWIPRRLEGKTPTPYTLNPTGLRSIFLLVVVVTFRSHRQYYRGKEVRTTGLETSWGGIF